MTLKELTDLGQQKKNAKHPSNPYPIPILPYTDKDSNGLTRCIKDFLSFNGHQAERITSTGRAIKTGGIITDVIGRSKDYSSTKWIKGSGRKGTADISATIHGRSVKIEVKIGKDRQSQYQKDYQKEIESAGGQYWIATGFDQFFNQYSQYILTLNPDKK